MRGEVDGGRDGMRDGRVERSRVMYEMDEFVIDMRWEIVVDVVGVE